MINKKYWAAALIFALCSLSNSYAETSNGFIIKFKTNSSFEALSCTVQQKCQRINKLKLQVVEKLPKDISNNPNVEYIEPNYIYRALEETKPDLSSEQWALKTVEAEKAWKVTTGSKDTVVAVIDTGIDYTHPNLKFQMWTNTSPSPSNDVMGANFSTMDDEGKVVMTGDPKDDHGHGTHCAGVIGAAHMGSGTKGLNAQINLMAVKFLDSQGSGSTVGAINSIIYATDHGAKILSNSWGGGSYSRSLKAAIEYAQAHGVLFVAAAGNEARNNDTKPTYPASYKLDNILSVAATDNKDEMAYFSNFGLSVHIAAPGVDILSTVLNGGFETMSGTSMATPHVAGAAALLLSLDPSLSYLEIKKRIIDSSDHIVGLEGKTSTGGRLNLHKLLNQ